MLAYARNLWGHQGMPNDEDQSQEKGREILRHMREGNASKKHLNQLKVRAEAALRRAVEARDEDAFLAALSSLGIDPASEAGQMHLRGFRKLGGKRY